MCGREREVVLRYVAGCARTLVAGARERQAEEFFARELAAIFAGTPGFLGHFPLGPSGPCVRGVGVRARVRGDCVFARSSGGERGVRDHRHHSENPDSPEWGGSHQRAKYFNETRWPFHGVAPAWIAASAPMA